MKIKVSELRETTKKAVLNYGYSKEESEIITEVLLYAQLRDNTQGVVKLIGSGIPKTSTEEPVIEKQTKVSALIDAKQNHAMLVINNATELAIQKAKENGVGIVGVKGISTSSGALGYYARKIADASLVGIVCSGAMEMVAVEGSSEPILGTNPLAVAFPTTEKPMVLDMTTAAMAYFGVVQADTAGQQLPAGIAFDKEGNGTTDPKEVLDGGALRSFDRSHKGSGISVMIQALTGPMMGAYFTGVGDVDANWGGHFILALDPEMFSGLQKTKEGVSEMKRRIKATRKLEGVSEILLPGEKGDRKTQEAISADETEVEENLYNELLKVSR
jgi:L-2-hydroxycarboxylate dehydrogenase (NAD+)